MGSAGQGQWRAAELTRTECSTTPTTRRRAAGCPAPTTKRPPFPLQNLPLGCVDDRLAVAIGDRWLDLRAAAEAGLLATLPSTVAQALRAPKLNPLFGLGRPAMSALRHALFDLLREGHGHAHRAADCLRPLPSARPALPCDVGDYTDFFASLNHARNTFELFRAGQAFLPNYKHLPIAYHGRASTVFAAPFDVRRPVSQIRPEADKDPLTAPSRKLDFEIELGFWIGKGNAHGDAIPLDTAEEHIAGVCLLNDWSARDVQAWESQPLGPFLSKNFATVVSPWVVTLDALAPFRVPPPARDDTDPAPQGYLSGSLNDAEGAFDIEIETRLQTREMRELGLAPTVVAHANAARDLWWTVAQMVAHHTVGGCHLRPGDLLGSGTISGATPGSEGSLLERTWNGAWPLALPGGESRRFLEDDDDVLIEAWCEAPGRRRIGLGQCRGRVLPARKATT
ncbi:fumarylacetoacetase [Aquabacterium sp. J223]|uniref:fumarylacetoacetase n=1 Tax=Aquabacterium sp. J223 TaxID=2898431 RepID=UPI002896D91B|nr:fumarylacetoacetase [Aquabacterium sp. J223]